MTTENHRKINCDRERESDQPQHGVVLLIHSHLLSSIIIHHIHIIGRERAAVLCRSSALLCAKNTEYLRSKKYLITIRRKQNNITIRKDQLRPLRVSRFAINNRCVNPSFPVGRRGWVSRESLSLSLLVCVRVCGLTGGCCCVCVR